MAKAKKSESKSETKSSAAPKAAKPQAAKSALPAAPMIDTNLAAASAAAMLAAGVNRKAAGTGGGATKPVESSTFKQLKSGLNKSSSTTVGNLLDKTHGPASQKQGNNPFGKKQASHHNQTFGADVNRAGVPRRTAG